MAPSNRDNEHRTNCSRRLLVFVSATIVVCLLCSGRLLIAQTAATGGLKGVINDPSGSVVPGVSVNVSSSATAQTRTVTSDSNGIYVVPLLPPGTYKVVVSAKGFKSVEIQKVEVHVTEIHRRFSFTTRDDLRNRDRE